MEAQFLEIGVTGDNYEVVKFRKIPNLSVGGLFQTDQNYTNRRKL